MSFLPFLQAAGPSTTGSFTSMIITFALMIAIFYFFLIRPQRKRQKETEKMLSALKKGDKVVTIGGIHGTISSVKEHTVVLKVDDNAKIEFNRTAIASVEKPLAEKNAEKSESEKSDQKKSSEKNKNAENPAASEK